MLIDYSYKPIAAVNHFGFGTAEGHYTVTDNDLMTFDDAKIIKKNKSILNNNNFMSSSHLLFHCCAFSDTEELTESCSWHISNDEKSLIENIWCDDVKMSNLTITMENIRALSFQGWVNDDVINCFFKW